MLVLDVGCGTGAITRGIAEAVLPGGFAVGVDRDADLIEKAIARASAPPNLRFERAEASGLAYDRKFDVVSSARTLQWIADVPGAISRMARAAKPGGLLVVLEYNHSLNQWDPEPPAPFSTFYRAFLEWRRSNGWDNEMAIRLPALFERAGLLDIQSHPQDETSELGAADFAEKTALWTDVILNLGLAMQTSGFIERTVLEEARVTYEEWRRHKLRKQTLSMATVVARVPFAHSDRQAD